MRSSLTNIDASLQKLGTTPTWFSSFENFFHGGVCVHVSECICLFTIHMVRGEVQVEQLMSDLIINLRGPSKYSKDRYIFCVSNILYNKTQYTERNKSNISIM